AIACGSRSGTGASRATGTLAEADIIFRVANLSLDAVVVRRSETLTAPVDGDLVMLDPRGGRYFGLDPIGHRIWALLEQPHSVASLCSTLEGEFDVTAETCRADTLALLEQMRAVDLVEVR